MTEQVDDARSRGAAAGRRGVQRQLDATAPRTSSSTSSAWPRRSGRRPGTPPTPRASSGCVRPTRDRRRAARATARSRSSAPPTAPGCSSEVAPDGRIHASFNQTVARTGRLSSDQPNLHNIPVRSALGRRFREAFIPAPGAELLVADYDQIELRVIAHLAQDPGLIEAFRAGVDIHAATAARVFSVDASEVTTAQRSKAKMISYGLAYGMEAYGLVATPRRPGRGGGRHPRPVLRRLPEREGVHVAHRRRGAPARLHRDPVRPPPLPARAGLAELPGPPGGRAAGDERRHPGARGRHLQGGARAPRRRARRPRAARAGSCCRCTTRSSSRASSRRPTRSAS